MITEAKDIPLRAMTHEQKLDVLLWLMVSEMYERKLAEFSVLVEAARALPEKKRVKELRRIKLSTWHGLSGRCLSDDPYRLPAETADRDPITLMAAAQSLRAAALELDIKAIVESLEVS